MGVVSLLSIVQERISKTEVYFAGINQVSIEEVTSNIWEWLDGRRRSLDTPKLRICVVILVLIVKRKRPVI